MPNATTVEPAAATPAVAVRPERKTRAQVPANYFAMKRCTDLLVLTLFAPFYLPLMLALGMVVKATSAGPVFYGQRRVGYRGRYFKAWKFRTMVPNADQILEQYLDANPEMRDEWERDHKLRKDPRITSIGRVLRKTSLDELPQLWNVFVGQMSLIGPRPIVSEEIDKYGDVFDDYKQVLPGITGLWQVSGRNNTTYERRVQLDKDYVSNWSLGRDLLILFRTIKTVLLREGAF